MFIDRFPNLPDLRVLDLGGTPSHWTRVPTKPAHVVVVNLDPFEATEGVDVVVADACDLPSSLNDFDLVYSNSLLEHLGGHERRRVFAGVVRDLAPRSWVQTPYRYFPIEPHWLFPGFQFLPLRTRVAITRRWPLGHIRAEGARAVEATLGVELVDRTEMDYLFPDSTILSERFCGLTKSLIAVRH